MRNPKKISNSLPNYRVVGAQIYSILDKLMDSLDGLEDRCLSSIGSEDCNCGPTAEQDDAFRRALRCIQDDAPMPNEKALDTKIEANLLWKIGRAMGDPDTDIIHQWLCSGAPAGISLPIADPGCIFPADIESHGEGETIDIPDHHGHTNYSSVVDDAAAEPEVNRLIETGFVKEFSSYEDLQLWVEGQPHLSRLGMITKEKDGKTKRRLILDCKESRVNERALGQQMPLTMLCIS